MSTGDSSFGLVLGLDVVKTKAKINSQLKQIIDSFNNSKNDKYKIKIGIQKTQSKKQIQQDIKDIISSFDNKNIFKVALNVNQHLTATNFVKEINQVIDHINKQGVHKIRLTTAKINPSIAVRAQPNKSETTSSSSNPELDHRIELIKQYRNELDRVNQKIQDLGIGTRNLNTDTSSTFATLKESLSRQLNDKSFQTADQNIFKSWIDRFNTLKSEISRYVSTDDTLDLGVRDTAVQKWRNFYEIIKDSQLVLDSEKQTIDGIIKNLSGLTSLREFEEKISALKIYETQFQNAQKYEKISNQNVPDMFKQVQSIQKYEAFNQQIRQSSLVTQQFKSDVQDLLQILNTTTNKTELEKTIEGLRLLEQEYQNLQKRNKQVSTAEEWKRQAQSIENSLDKLRQNGLETSKSYNDLIALRSALQSIGKNDADGLKNISAEFRTIRTEIENLELRLKDSQFIEDKQNTETKFIDFKQRIDEVKFSTTDWTQKVQELNTAWQDVFTKANLSRFQHSLNSNVKLLDKEIAQSQKLESLYKSIVTDSFKSYSGAFSAIKAKITNMVSPQNLTGTATSTADYTQAYNQATQSFGYLTTVWEKLNSVLTNVSPTIKATEGDINKLTDADKQQIVVLLNLINEYEKVQSAINTNITLASNILGQNQNAQKTIADLRQLQLTMETFSKGNTRMFQNTYFRSQYSELSQDIQKALGGVAQGIGVSQSQVEEFTNRWRHLKNEIANAGATGQTFGSKLASQFSKLGVYFSAATVFMRIRSSLRNMYENVKEVDNAMTSLKRVTKETHSTYQGFLDDSIVRAKKLGTTLSDTISATADFTRLGYSIKEATALSTSALTYQQVGDEVEDINTATSSIVSTMKAFGIQAQDSMMIVDRFNEVANNFSITAGGIGEALQNSASSLSAANNTLEESLGLIIAGNDVVQNPNEVGTALKTLTMRLRNAKADLSELGEDTDGMADSVSKLRGQIKALSGVDIMSSKDEFKSTYQILQELSKVWGTLTDVNQASLTELIAGKRQGNLMSSIMKNFQDAESVVRVANRSAGSAETEHEKKLRSINGKLSILQSTYQELSDTVMEDGLVKNAIKQLTNLLEIINRLVKSSGSLRTAISLIATALLSFNNKGLFTRNSLGQMGFAWTNYQKSIEGEKDSINNALKTIFDKETNQQSWAYYASTKGLVEGTSEYNKARATFITDRLKEYNAELTKGIVNTENLNQAQAKLANNASFLSVAFTKLKGVVKGLGNIVLSVVNIFVNMALSMAVSAFLGAIISLFQKTTKAIEGANQATQDFISRAKDLSNIQESIVSLKEKLADKNITEEESLSIRKQLYEIQENMIDRYGSEAQGIDLVRDSVDALNNSFDELRKKELQTLYLNNVTGYQKSLASLYGEDSIRSWGWNTGNETIKLEYGFKDDVLKQLSSVLGEDYVRGGTEDFRTLYLDIGKFIKDNGGTKVDLVAKYDEVILALDKVAKDYKEKSYDDSEIQTVIQHLGAAKKYWTGGTYKEELENTQTYAEYLVLDDTQYNKAYTALRKARDDYNNAIASGNQKLIWDTASHYLTAQQDVQKIINELGEYDEEGAVKDFLQNFVDKADNELAQHKFELKIQADENQLKTTLDKALIQFANGKKIFADDIINFNPNADINKNNTQIVTAFQDISKQAEEAGVSLQTFVSWLVELGMVESDTATKKTYNFVKMLDMTSESMSAITTKIDEVQKAFTTVKEVIEDYEDKKILTIDSAQKLIDLGDKYIQYLFDENGHLEVNEKAYEKLTKAKIESLKAELLHNAIDNIKQIKTEADAVEYLKDKVTEETKATNEYNTALLQRLYLEGISNKNTKIQQAVQYIYDTYTNYSRVLDNVNTEYKANEMASTSVTKGLNEQKNALEKQKRVLDKSKDSLDKNKTALERNKTALEESNSELEKNKGYIEDLISLTVDMLKKKYEEEKEVIEKTKEAYKEKVDALKESLDKEKEAYDRHESYFKQNQDIATLEKQASALSGTKSVEGIQRLSEIQKELSEKKQSLYDTQYSDSISDRKEALDKEYEYREKIWDKEINRIDELLKNERQLRIQAMELIDSKTQQFYNNLWEYVYKYTTKSRYEFDNLWNNAYRALEKYGFGQLTCLKIMDLLERQIYENQQAVDGLDRQIKILNKSIDGTSDSINGVSKEIENLDNKINELTKSYETATKTKETFEMAKQVSGFQATLGGNTYLSATTDPNKASADILSQYNDYLNTYAKGAPYHRYSLEEVQKQMSAYASGTLASKGGLAVVDEDGLNSEWILKKGRVDYLPENSVVFNKSETQALKFLAQSSDKVKKIISNPDYLSYFNSYLNQENVSSHMVNGVKSWYQNINANQQKTFNMPLTINISNSQQLNERQLANRIKDDVFHELNKYGAWNG